MNPHDILKYGNLTFQHALSAIPKAEWETQGVCGWWSVKNIVAHLASYELVLVDVLTFFVEGGETPQLHRYLTGHAFNDDQVFERQANSPDETLAEYVAAHENAMACVGKIPPEQFQEVGTLPWYGMEYALDDYIVYAFYGHKREHSAQIDVFKDKLKAK
jgi:hypothetical protein